MNRNKKQVEARREFVNKAIKERGEKKIEAVVLDVSERLFVSPSTIWKDIRDYKPKQL